MIRACSYSKSFIIGIIERILSIGFILSILLPLGVLLTGILVCVIVVTLNNSSFDTFGM